MISYDDFKKVEIRTGKILAVEEVPETDKLLKLTVDFGEEAPRQIVSGIKHKVVDWQSIVGMTTTFVTNLEPRTIKGLESNGMLFALGGDEHFSFLVPKDDVPPGSIAG
ncbi:MAG: tRNA-binding protein [Patescibacteria group bacterium]|jgi:methionyl-tRNA synthetase|nr:tRNA-binding protein [Patescibacteria group bacterium]